MLHGIHALGLAMALIPKADYLVPEVGDYENCLRSQAAPLLVGHLEAGRETF